MSNRSARLLLALSLTAVISACGGDSETGPSPVDGPNPGLQPSNVNGGSPVMDGPPGGELSVQCFTEWDGYQCKAIVGPWSTSPQDVTGFARWSTSDSRIATVDTVGWVTVRGSGEIVVRADYRGLHSASNTMWIEPRIPPAIVRTFWGVVTDAQNGGPLSGVTVQILDGLNANRSTMTGVDGAYQMENMGLSHVVTALAFRVRFSKPGYVPLERTIVITTNQSNHLNVSLSRQ